MVMFGSDSETRLSHVAAPADDEGARSERRHGQ